MGYADTINRAWTWGVPKRVTRAAVALPQTATDDLFTIVGGPVNVVLLFGEVTVQIGAFANNTHLSYNPTIGTAANVTAVLNINARDVDTLFGVDSWGAAMFGLDNAGFLQLPRLNRNWGLKGTAMEPGVIILNCAGSDGGGGRIVWYLWYIALEQGAYVLAA